MTTHGEKIRETWRLVQRRGLWYLALAGSLGIVALAFPPWRPFLVLALLGMGWFAILVLLLLLLLRGLEMLQDTPDPDEHQDPWDDLD